MSVDTVQPGLKAVELADAPPLPTPPAPKHGPVKRLRRQAAPHYAVGLLMLAAMAARFTVFCGVDEAAAASAVALVAFVAGVIAAFRVRARVFDSAVRTWACACLAAAGTWLTTVTAIGLFTDMIGLLVAAGYALAMPWWRHHRDRFVGVDDSGDQAPEQTTEEAVHAYVRRWARNIGKSNAALPGSRLEAPEEIERGIRFVLRLVPGMQDISMVQTARKRIRAGLRLFPKQDLIIEQHPLLDESCVLVTIVTDPAILDSAHIPWPGPDLAYHDGLIDLGPFVDGEGVASWVLYRRNGMFGGFIGGSPGSGKSRVLEGIALAAAGASDPTVIWYADGQGGASSPMLHKLADWSACRGDDRAGNIQQTRNMLAAGLLIKNLRQAENIVDELEGFTPSVDRPGILIILDEQHELFEDPEIQEATTILAREGRKVGIAVIGATQSVTLEAFGKTAGNAADTLRGCMIQGNLLVMRTKSNNPKNVLRLGDIDPNTFPPVPGYAYYITDDPERRSAPLRTYLVDNEARVYWPTQIFFHTLDLGSATAAGSAYGDRHAVAAVAHAELVARVAAMRAGQPVKMPTTSKPAAPSFTIPAGTGSGSAPGVLSIPTWGGEAIVLAPFPTIDLSTATRPAPAAPVGEYRVEMFLTGSDRAVFDIVAAHPGTPSQIIAAAGDQLPVAERRFKDILKALVERGHLRNTNGFYSVNRDTEHHGQGPRP